MNNNKYFYTINGEKVIFDNYKEYTKGNCAYLYKNQQIKILLFCLHLQINLLLIEYQNWI